MVKGKEQAPQSTEESPVLSQKDRKCLEESGVSLLSKFFAHYPHEFPDALLLPDASARPLYYLINPSISAVCEQRGVRKPSFIFFKMMGSDKSLNWVNRCEFLYDQNYEVVRARKMQELADLERQAHENDTQQVRIQQQISSAEMFFKMEETPEIAYTIRKTAINRAREVMTALGKQGIVKPDFAIFDDIFCDGMTIDEIRKALTNQSGNDAYKQIPAYVLVQINSDNYNAERINPVYHGSVFTESEDDFGARVFDYKGNENIGRERIYGVEKYSNSYMRFFYSKSLHRNEDPSKVEIPSNVTLSTNRNLTAMKKFRAEVKEIGQKVSAKLIQ
jgi:hypothetical protein